MIPHEFTNLHTQHCGKVPGNGGWVVGKHSYITGITRSPAYVLNILQMLKNEIIMVVVDMRVHSDNNEKYLTLPVKLSTLRLDSPWA